MTKPRHTNNFLESIQDQKVQQNNLVDNSEQQSQSNSEEDYQLIPRQYPIYSSPRKDAPLQCQSKPFIYKKLEVNEAEQNSLKNTVNNIRKSQQDQLLRESIRQTSKKFSSSKKFDQMAVKQVESQHDIQFPLNQNQKQRQKQMEQSNISFVSISSEKRSETSKSNSEVQNSNINQQQQKQGKKHSSSYIIETTKIVSLQEHSNIISNPMISINSSSEENQMEEVVAKYHFQTQKSFSQKLDNVNQGFIPSLNLIKVSPVQKNKVNDESNAFFQPKKQQIKQQDLYSKYKKSAQKSPISIQKLQDIQNQKNSKYNQSNLQNQQLTFTFYNKNLQKKPLYETEQNADYDQKLTKSMLQVDHLRKQLLKSTQNNINAIFSSKISSEQCQVAQMVDKINKKVGQVCQKVQDIERKRVIEMQKQIQRRRVLQSEKRQKDFEREEYEIQRQRQSRGSYNIGRSENMVLDFGKGGGNEGKIIAIYPNNRNVNIKDLIFGQREVQNRSGSSSSQKESTLKMMMQMQQTFISALKTFQTSVNQSLNLKLKEIKKVYEQNQQSKKQQSQRQQKLERISQQTTDRQHQQYDDSRGSINVMYLRKLRQLEQDVRQKQCKIERLEKQNYYMEKQLQKVQEMGFTKKGRQSRIDILSPLKNKDLYGESLSFNNHNSRKVQNQINYAPVSPLQTYNGQQNNLHFSFSPKNQKYHHQNYPSPSSSQGYEQRIHQPVTMTNQQVTYLNSQNAHSKKKSTHSFHHYQSKIIQSKQIIQMKERLSQFQLLIKQKDLRIRQLENTIMDHLESSRKWKKDIEQQSQSSKSSKISGYSSVKSQQENNQILHMKINNLKTLLKQSKSEVQNYKKLYEAQKSSNTTTPNSNQQIRLENAKLGCDDMKSNTNTSRSLCVSDKTTIKNEKYFINGRTRNSPFVEITQTQTVGQKSRHFSSHGNQIVFDSLINQNGAVSIITGTLINFIMMAWSLKDVITKLCGSQVNVEKINRNARQFLTELKEKDQNIWKKVWIKLDQGEFDSRIRDIWSE